MIETERMTTPAYSFVDVKPDAPPSMYSTLRLLAVCSPRLALNTAWAAQWAALGPLLQVLLSPSSVQLVQLVGPISGLLLAPTVGVWSDNCTSKFGRRRPFLCLGALLSCLCWLVMMFAVEIGEALGDTPAHLFDRSVEPSRAWTARVVVFTYVWMDVALNLTQTPLTLLIADCAGDRLVTASAIGSAYSIAGSFLVSGYILAFGPAHESVKPFLCVLIAAMATTIGLVMFAANETPRIDTHSTTSTSKAAFAAVWDGVRRLPRVLSVYCVVLVFVQYGFFAYNGAKGQFFGLVVKNGSAFGADTCGHDSNPPCSAGQTAFNDGVALAGGATDTMYNVVSLVYLGALPALVRRCGVQRVLIASLLPQSLLIVLSISKVIVLDVAIVVGCSFTQNTLLALYLPTICHVIGVDEDIGVYAGAINSAMCAGQFFSFVLASVLVTSSMGYGLPILVGGVMSLLGFVIAAMFFRIQLFAS
ncbi:hypothetical protein SDRG_09313 [Saprolegnia diclina VS20]|uniref:Major facilitator superfamily (MFS) profile domain-containing protein n=1 Tax=Saprolegnia diclina (strain VS20) TaxID=1156394 RepID=T0RSW9_SAPDV|nr:hypothetical protein SDRG_09313 [Saprolegnia diclina VS20]EQC33337.1 hypothetical protein SDRG_09313 [Saprolegnia diclina VS20]|eukprot:XP_008613460.1 hypothetical protein SDRG_09313 [Saprolegnia diclina VS20]